VRFQRKRKKKKESRKKMVEKTKMSCPDCGVEMNHHAEKIDYAAAFDEGDAIDADFGGVVEEAHCCPACGMTLTRKAVEAG
jgi:ribosomal protein S27AE